ncbi:MAG: 50S ribosomal protein L13 [Candidatus Andersenbacteria bacterium]|nr:50S ribosomal protein L13 [Candidatus Andersenbacteria bacterium]
MMPNNFRQSAEMEWHHVDAAGAVLGRLATRVAGLLIGKHRLDWQQNTVAPVYVVVTNTNSVILTGKKEEQKLYHHYTGYPGGIKKRTPAAVRQRDSRRMVRLAVEGMLPKNSLRPVRLGHLKLYTGATHPHEAQVKQL